MRLPSAWYPVCRSAAVRCGQVRRVEAFGGSIVVFRGEDGRCGALSARCAHLGANLAQGTVRGVALVCPLHARCFATSGERLDRGPDGSHGQPAFPVEERFGIVFVFRGGTPTAALPVPTGGAMGMHTHVQEMDGQATLAMVGANAFDTVHLLPVHGRAVVGEPVVRVLSREAIHIAFQTAIAGSSLKDRCFRLLGAAQVRLEIESHGGALLIFHNRRIACSTIYAVLPVDAQRVRIFMVSGSQRSPGPIGWAVSRLRLAAHHLAALAIHRQDARALSQITPGAIHLDPVSDRTLQLWLEHFNELPCSDGQP